MQVNCCYSTKTNKKYSALLAEYANYLQLFGKFLLESHYNVKILQKGMRCVDMKIRAAEKEQRFWWENKTIFICRWRLKC